MKTIKGPAIFLAQFMADEEPFSNIEAIAEWAAKLGFIGIQVPIGNSSFIDVALAAESKEYCDELAGRVGEKGVVITELSTHLEGQLVAVHPTYDELFDGFAPVEVRGNPAARTEWATEQVKLAARASANLGHTAQVSFSGALLCLRSASMFSAWPPPAVRKVPRSVMTRSAGSMWPADPVRKPAPTAKRTSVVRRGFVSSR